VPGNDREVEETHELDLEVVFIFSHEPRIKKATKLRGLSPRANYTDRATAACRRILIDRGCCVVSATDPHGRILGFLDRHEPRMKLTNEYSGMELTTTLGVSPASQQANQSRFLFLLLAHRLHVPLLPRALPQFDRPTAHVAPCQQSVSRKYYSPTRLITLITTEGH
jgi:hypothetical protein